MDGAAAAGGMPGRVVDLRPGSPWTASIDQAAWRRAWRTAAMMAPPGRLDPIGLPELRAEIVDYMRRGRGIATCADRVMVTRGATNGLDLLAATVLRPGDRVGIEEPGYLRAREVLAARGAHVVACPVDEHGLITEELPDDLKLIYTTPSHQYPLGGVLPVPRRQQLVDWARRTGALIAEDDYDGEFRYDVAPMPALYGLDPQVVVYLGTTSKSMSPALGVGWLVARPDLVAAVAGRRTELADRTATVAQEAVRVLLDRGDLDRHVRRMRAEYARRRAAVVAALDGMPIMGDTAGLHLVVPLSAGATGEIIAKAAAEGILLDGLERHHLRDRPAYSGLVIGYGAASTADLTTAVAWARRHMG